jgi:hypothetical protein
MHSWPALDKRRLGRGLLLQAYNLLKTIVCVRHSRAWHVLYPPAKADSRPRRITRPANGEPPASPNGNQQSYVVIRHNPLFSLHTSAHSHIAGRGLINASFHNHLHRALATEYMASACSTTTRALVRRGSRHRSHACVHCQPCQLSPLNVLNGCPPQ